METPSLRAYTELVVVDAFWKSKISSYYNVAIVIYVINYHEGTDPDDVFQGEIYNSWLLSAMSILAASGGILHRRSHTE